MSVYLSEFLSIQYTFMSEDLFITLKHAALFGVLLHVASLHSLDLSKVEGKDHCLNLTSEVA